MITCQDADVLAAAHSVGSLDSGEVPELEQHLAGCADCRRLAAEYMDAAARLPLALAPMQPPAALRGRIMRAVYAEAAQARTAIPTAPAQAWWQRFWAAIPAGRGFTVVAAAAAALVIALGSWSATHSAAPAASLSVALVSTPAAPNAHGQLVYTASAHQAVLTVNGLPGPSSLAGTGSVYEVWLIRPNGAAVPAAYLSQNPDGTWSAALRGDMAAYSTVAATVEPAGGSIAPTGQKVVEGFITGTSSGDTPAAAAG